MWNQKRVPSTLPQAKKTWSSSDSVSPARYYEHTQSSIQLFNLSIGAWEMRF